jgi:hypothetical protein
MVSGSAASLAAAHLRRLKIEPSALYRLCSRGEISDEAFHRIQEELDWSELDAAPAAPGVPRETHLHHVSAPAAIERPELRNFEDRPLERFVAAARIVGAPISGRVQLYTRTAGHSRCIASSVAR